MAFIAKMLFKIIFLLGLESLINIRAILERGRIRNRITAIIFFVFM